VDVSLLIYNNVTESFEENTVLATNIPNSGSASITLPDTINSGLPLSDYNLHTAIVKVGVNTSTTSLDRSKRSSHISAATRILEKLKVFAKARLISTIKTSITRRLLCELWVRAAPQFTTTNLPPCPCNVSDASKDSRFIEEKYDNEYVNAAASLLRQYVLHPKSRSCYRQANVRQVKHTLLVRLLVI